MDENAILAPFPPARHIDPATIASARETSGTVFVVLDDDPTGTQSVAHLPVLTSWTEDDMEWAFDTGAPAVYVMSNTRSLDPESAAARIRDIARPALAVSERRGIRVAFVSRGDSTLRGHFPLETDVLSDVLRGAGRPPVDGVLVVPAFPDAGRITIDGVHYYRSGGALVPVGETEFAADSTFGYAASDLADWVEEKTAGSVAAADVVRITLHALRAGAEAVAAILAEAATGSVIVADAVVEDDLRALALGLELAETGGRTYIYRVGPPFMRARIGQEIAEPVPSDELAAEQPNDHGGLVVVGSHVGLTSRQLEALRLDRPDITAVELSVEAVLDADVRDAHLAEVVARISEALTTNEVVLNTSRLLVTAASGEESLAISRAVSAAVVEVVRRVLATTPPRFVIAKGGITSSDVATEGLGIRHAIVRGPLLPGIVSLWAPQGGPADGIPYVVFAGNVGDDDSLAAVVARLSAHRDA